MNDSEYPAAPDDRSRLRRFIEVTAFWLVYIGLGEALGLGPSQGEIETYLLLGFPLVILFQVLVVTDSDAASFAIAYAIIATVGAGAAAYAFGLFRRETWRYLFLCVLWGPATGP